MEQNKSQVVEPEGFLSSEEYYIFKQKEICSLLHDSLTESEILEKLKFQWKKLSRKIKLRYKKEMRLYNKKLIQQKLNTEEEIINNEPYIEKKQTQPKRRQIKKRQRNKIGRKKKKPLEPEKNVQEQVSRKLEEKQSLKRGNIKSKTLSYIQVNILQKLDLEEMKPVPHLDFLNSANLIDHIGVLSISNNKQQGQIEFDKIKSVISHTYGVMNFTHIEDLKLQLFFEVSFHPRQNGQNIDNTFCTSKQAALYCYDLAKNYILDHKDIFTKDIEYYLQ